MKLRELFREAEIIDIIGSLDADIKGICCDSRICKEGHVFFAISGFEQDGHQYIDQAIENGAVAIVRTRKQEECQEITYIDVKDTRKSLSYAASNFFNNPTQKLKVIGITGTNGKTSTTFYLRKILESYGRKVGIIGTLGAYCNKEYINLVNTTPESVRIHEIIRKMLDSDIEYVLMEVSPHSLEMDRVDDVSFYGAIFTNLTRDHLDFHKDMDDYFNAKKKLFDFKLKSSVINVDDAYGHRLYHELNCSQQKIYAFGEKTNIGSKISNFKTVGNISYFDLNNITFSTTLLGKFIIFNLSAAILMSIDLGVPIEYIKKAVEEIKPVVGRMDRIEVKNSNLTIIIDYAHTPDGLENVLTSLTNHKGGKLITLFGCDGDRDKEKRPLMGKISGEYSDYTVITSDNPRWEDPLEIIEDIVSGISETNGLYEVVPDRLEAIRRAMLIGKGYDTILIAGKGHEKHQLVKGEKIDFDERQIVEKIAREIY